MDKIKEAEIKETIKSMLTWNELKWLGFEQLKFKDRIDSLLGWIKEICTEEENDNRAMKKYRKLERDKFELEIWGYNNKIEFWLKNYTQLSFIKFITTRN